MRSIPARAWALAALSSLLQFLAFPIAGPTPQWRRAFCWICLVPLLMAFSTPDKSGGVLRPRLAAVLGYLSGVLWYLGNCYWIFPTMNRYGGIPAPAAFGILLLFCLYLGLYHALFGYLIGLLHSRISKKGVLCAAPFLWVAVELARARITGFPWDLLGYTQVDNLTLSRLAPWTGVFGLSLLVALINMLWLIRLPARGRWTYFGPALATAFVIAATMLAYRNVPQETTDASAVLLQENLSVGQEANGVSESKSQMLASFSGLSLNAKAAGAASANGSPAAKPQIVIWPEAPADFFDGDPEFRASLGALAKTTNAPVIADSVTVAQSDNRRILQAYNSASFFAPDGTHVGRYDKMHLVPFGEYVPYKQLFFFAGHLLDSVGPFIPGLTRELFRSGGHRYGVFICYESIFGDEMREFSGLGADVLVNISDDGWYGDSSAPWEHLDMVRMRAIENHRWVLRATNTGVTAAIDTHGRVLTQMPRHVRGAISVPFAFEHDTTFYTWHGDWVAWLTVLVSVCVLGMSVRRRRAVN